MTDIICEKHQVVRVDALWCARCVAEDLLESALKDLGTPLRADAYLEGFAAMTESAIERDSANLARKILGERPEMARLRLTRERLVSQDNFATADPVYTVERKMRDYGYDDNYTDKIGWIDSEGSGHAVTRENDPTLFSQLEAWHTAGEPTKNGLPGDEAGREDMWTRTGYVERWQFVQAFLTYDAALAYRESEAHNLGESRVYVASGYRNPEWKWLRALLLGGDPR